MADIQIDARVDHAVRDALARHGGLGQTARRVGAEEDLYACGLTSLGSVRVMLAIEESLSIEFPQEMLTRDLFATIGTLVTACTGLIGSSPVASSAEPPA